MKKFDAIVASYMRRLINDLGVTVLDSAAVFGNGGLESGGFEKLQEQKPTVKGSLGGFGWFQWTGPRRKAFMAFCKKRMLEPSSDEASYQFLVFELQGSERGALAAMMRAKSLEDKVIAFEEAYERAGVKHYPDRIKYAKRALAAYKSSGIAGAPASPTVPETVIVKEPVVVPGLDKPMLESKSWWSGIVGIATVIGSAFSDRYVQITLVIIAAAFLAFMMWDRRHKAELQRNIVGKL